MTPARKVSYLLLTYAAIVFLPYIGGLIAEGGAFPENYFEYPPLKPLPKAGFNQVIFIIVSILFAGAALLYLFPPLFGFKKPDIPERKKVTKVPLPMWFWIGLVMWGGTLFVLWGKFSEPKWLLYWAFIPLFWGFILMLDGWVYRRTGGKITGRDSPKEMVGIAVAAMFGWMLFEYLNFFVNDNWFYPAGHLIPDEEFLLYAIIGSSGLMPPVFLLYHLMQTLPRFSHRFDLGIKISLPHFLKVLLLALALFSMFAIGFFPDTLFGALWVSPLIILAVVLDLMGMWTPFTPVKKGNWSPLLMYALTYFIFGLLLECWNYFSATHEAGRVAVCYTPAHWVYSLPYVNKYHLFEMPFLGYLGYLPFGVYCAVWWSSFAFLLNINSKYPLSEESKE